MGGGIYGDGARLVMSDVVITGNAADYGGGMAMESSEVTLTDGAVTLNAGFQGGGVWASRSGTVTSITTDWGTSTQDNAPEDVLLIDSAGAESPSYSYGAAESFTCTVDTLVCE